MTAVCGGGPSQSRPGFDGGVNWSAAGISAAIQEFVPEPAASIIAGVIADDVSDLTSFCAVDPPGDPNVGPLDYLALLNPEALDDYLAARDKFRQWWHNIMWYRVCMCSTGTTPPVGTVSTPGPSLDNPGAPSGDSGAPCWEGSYSSSVPVVHDSVSGITDMSQVLPGSTTVTVTPWHTGGLNSAKTIPTGVNHMLLQADASGTGPGPVAMIAFYNASGAAINTSSLYLDYSAGASSGHKQQALTTLPTGAVSWSCELDPYFGGGSAVQGSLYTVTLDFTYACTTSVNTPVTPCCPPDTSTEIRLQQLLTLVTNIAVQVANNATPTDWAEGSVHSGLTGNGSFGISGSALAIKLHMDTIPPQVGDVLDSPTYYFDAGFITFTTLEGSYSGQRITYADQVFSVPFMGFQVNYTLNMGTTATVTELVRPT